MTHAPDIYDWLLYEQEQKMACQYLETLKQIQSEMRSDAFDRRFWDNLGGRGHRQKLVEAYKHARRDMALDPLVQKSEVWELNITATTWNFPKIVVQDQQYFTRTRMLSLGIDPAPYIQLAIIVKQNDIHLRLDSWIYSAEVWISKEMELQALKERWEQEFDLTAQDKRDVEDLKVSTKHLDTKASLTSSKLPGLRLLLKELQMAKLELIIERVQQKESRCKKNTYCTFSREIPISEDKDIKRLAEKISSVQKVIEEKKEFIRQKLAIRV